MNQLRMVAGIVFCFSVSLMGCASIPKCEASPDKDLTVPPDFSLKPEVAQETEKHWYAAVGFANYHPRLKVSDEKLQRQLGLIEKVPGWRSPDSFSDYRDRRMLWDMTVGVGRDITPRTAWMLWTGGAKGTIKNRESYLGGLLNTDIRFTRATWFLTAQVYYYPFDKPALPPTRGLPLAERIGKSLSHAKPYVSLATGYSGIYAEGDGKFKLRGLGTVFRQYESYTDHMLQISPRLGLDIPLTSRASMTTEIMYYWFTRVPGTGGETNLRREYFGPSVFIGYKRKF